MKAQLDSSKALIIGIVVLVAAALVFWMLLLSPKREEAGKLATDVERLESSLQQSEASIAAGEAAKKAFPSDYQSLVVLGKAVPRDDDVASLLVQLNRIGERAGGEFLDITLTSGGGEAEAPPTPPAPGEEPASPTEVAASLLPLGAAIGPAGLAVMPYEITFDGNFFEIADFIAGLDSLVKTDKDGVTVDGRLVTVDGFSLEADPDRGFPALRAGFSLTTYLTQPGQTTLPGASGALEGSTPASITTGGAE